MKIKAIYIDAQNKTVSLVEIEAKLTEYYRLIRCELVEVAHYFANADVMYVDEEGLINNTEEFITFDMDDAPGVPIAGSALIVGSDLEGNSVSCKTSLEDIESRVAFTTRAKLRAAVENARGMGAN